MTNPGSIYILLNASMPKLLKIGKTTKSPEDRAAELSVSTGVPTPYHVAHYVLVDDCDLVEREVHKRLEAYRINDRREFFSVPLRTALMLLSEFESASPDAAPPPPGGHVPKSSTSFPKEENAILALALEFQATAPRWQDSIEDCTCLNLAHWLGKPEAQAQLETLESKMCFSDRTLARSTASFYESYENSDIDYGRVSIAVFSDRMRRLRPSAHSAISAAGILPTDYYPKRLWAWREREPIRTATDVPHTGRPAACTHFPGRRSAECLRAWSWHGSVRTPCL